MNNKFLKNCVMLIIFGFSQTNFPVQIFVKNTDGKTLTIEIDKDATITDLKKEIQKNTNIALSKQNLISHGKALNDNEKIKNIIINETINLVVKKGAYPIGETSTYNDIKKAEKNKDSTYKEGDYIIFIESNGKAYYGEISSQEDNKDKESINIIKSINNKEKHTIDRSNIIGKL